MADSFVRILGLDPGTARTGYGVIERGPDGTKLIKAGVLSTPAGDEPAARLASLSAQLEKVLTTHSPAEAAIEKLFFAKNTTTAMQVAEARGVLLAVCAKAKLRIGEYTPMQVKQSVSGYGGAGKSQVAEMVVRILKLKEAPKPDDAADAVAIALCHEQWRNLPS